MFRMIGVRRDDLTQKTRFLMIRHLLIKPLSGACQNKCGICDINKFKDKSFASDAPETEN